MNRFARLARLEMMTPMSLLRIAFFALTVTLVILAGGCMKRSAPPAASLSTTPKQTSPVPNPPPSEEEQVKGVVTSYLTALEKSNYGEAYDLLSQSSKNRHNISDFEQQGKKGMPSFDLTSAKATVDDDTAVVDLQQIEDSAAHEIHLVREEKDWKIVYQGGAPGSPYP